MPEFVRPVVIQSAGPREQARQLLIRIFGWNGGRISLPLTERVNAPLLGAFNVHDRIYCYDKGKSLEQIIEQSLSIINDIMFVVISSWSDFILFADRSQSRYSLLRAIHEEFSITTILILSKGEDAGFIMNEDDPACFLSFGSADSFERHFMPPVQARRVFAANMMDWQITTLKREEDWLRRIRELYSLE